MTNGIAGFSAKGRVCSLIAERNHTVLGINNSQSQTMKKKKALFVNPKAFLQVDMKSGDMEASRH